MTGHGGYQMSTNLANTAKVKERINRLSLIGFFLSFGYILVSILFWFVIYADSVLIWRDAREIEILLFCVAIILIEAILALSIIGLVRAAKRRNKRSKKFGIAGILITCFTLAANIVVFFTVNYDLFYRAFAEYMNTN